jgi:diguanylate cyclase
MSTAGAFGLPLFAFLQPEIIISGGMKYLIAIWLFSTFSFGVTFYVGRLSDAQFALLGFGGMVGIAWSAYLVTDPAAARAIVALLAAVPAIAAMGSSRRVTISFTLFAMVLAVLLSSVNATSGVAIVVAGGAAVTTVFVPVFMVYALRQSLGSVLRKVAMLGDTDPLTGVLNRRGLLSRNGDLLERIVRTRQAIGFMMMDFDNFKFVNDNHGHAAGDSVLIAAAAAIEELVSPRSIISRFGGEEFVVMTESASAVELVDLAEQIRRRIQAECGVTMSIGAIYAPLIRSASGRPNIDEVIDFLTRQADRCMYAAKDAGRNKVISRTCAPIVWVPGPPNEPQIEFVADERRVGNLEIVRRRKAAARGQAATTPFVDDQSF